MATRDDIYTAIRNADAAGDTASVQKLGAYLQTMDAADHQKAAAAVESDPITQGARNFTDDMGPVGRFAAGVGKRITDVGRGVGQLVPGLVSRQDVADSRKLDAPLMATTAGKAGDIVGTIAATAPAALIPGANTILGGAAIGALTGALEPSVSTGETLKNIITGGAGGAAVPAIVTGARTLRAAAEPFYQAGQNRIVGRALNRAAGNDAPAVANRLEQAAQPFVGPSQGVPRTTMGELVPGSMPTVGQAAGNPGVAALERAATAGNPEVTNAVSNIMQQQNAARVGVLEDMAGRTSGERDFLGAARDATADQLYANARANGLRPLSARQQAAVGDLMQRPALQDALAQARRLAANEGLNITDPSGSVAGLDYVRRALADQVTGATGNERRILQNLQTQLTGVMDRLSPDLRAARETFAGMSRPLNQMDTAQEIASRAISPLSGNLQPNAFARAYNDTAAVRATGMPTATLENTMAPAQLNALERVLQDVQRSTAAQNAGRGVGSDTVQKLAYSNILDQSGVPTLLRDLKPAQVLGNIASRGADAAYGRANRELSSRLAEVMLDPGQAAQLMRQATPQQRNQILQLLQRAGSGLAISAPATANALQQQ